MSRFSSHRAFSSARFLTVLLTTSALLSDAPSAKAQDFVWLEGEAATTTLKPNLSGWGRPEWLSGQKWLHLAIDAKNVEKELPADSGVLSYEFSLAKAGKQQIWNRIGFEFVRSPFEWRVDGGAWTRVAPDELTTDLMGLADWTEVAWLRLGEQEMTAGKHTLEIRLPLIKNAKNEVQRVNYASDALVIAPNFSPNGAFKPDESGRTGRDDVAAKNVFTLPEFQGGARSSVALKGEWEICRDDEMLPGEVAAPIEKLPANPLWKAIAVPGDKNKLRPDLALAHRVWYRTRVNVPASQIGRAFWLEFPLNNLNTTVFVNGQRCGFSPTPFARFQTDVSKAIKAGDNEIWVGIRDAYYGFQAKKNDPMFLRRTWNYPVSWWNKGFMKLDYPVWNCPQSGLLNTPVFHAGGAAYASDVFVQPSVKDKKLNAQVTLLNSAKGTMSGEIRATALDPTGKEEKTFAATPFSVGAGEEKVVNWSQDWANPRLWWPDSPQMTTLRLQLVVNGQVVDQSDTPFGFREWRTDGIKYTLNGQVWHIWADIGGQGGTKEQFLDYYKRTGQRTFRFVTAGQTGTESHFWKGLETDAALDWFDRNGVTVRRNSTLDGEVIGYAFAEEDPDVIKENGGSKVKMELMRRWREQCVAQVRGERNHPSIQIWTIENEFAYINLINLLGNSPTMDEYEREIIKTSDAVMAVDPSRSVMIDGGGATKFQGLPTHGDHYVWGGDPNVYPERAYEKYPEGGGRGRWVWDEKRPRFLGEDFFATGVNPADYAAYGGEEAFLGKGQAKPAVDRVYRMLTEGYRWGGHYAAWHFWVGEDTTGPNAWKSNAPVALFARQHDWTFASGQSVKRTWGLFNDSRFADPITFSWTLTLDGKKVGSKSALYSVAPGTAKKWDENLTMSVVAKRAEGELLLTLSQGGKEVFRDTKSVSVLPPLVAATPTTQTRALAQLKPPAKPVAAKKAPALLVFDPQGTATAFLKKLKMSFTLLPSLENLPSTPAVLLLGSDALDAREATSSRLAAWVATGQRLVALDQKNPLKFQGLPAEVEPSSTEGFRAFGEDLEHPVLRGLAQKDFEAWNTETPLFRDAYLKPSSGAKSLVQAGARLKNSVLLEAPVGSGLMLLSQFNIGQNLDNPVAGRLLLNLLSYGQNYKQEFRPTVLVSSDPQLQKAADAIKLQYTRATEPLAALSDAKTQLLIVSATPQNLKALVANKPKVEAFMARGGYIVFHGLGAEELSDYNALVGFDHMIRPMRRERISFPSVKSSLTAGLNLGDVVLLSGERIFGWTADEYVVSDLFSAIVDYEDVAPFGKSESFAFPNAVNNFVNADSWKLINNFDAPKNGPWELPFSLPKLQSIREFAWVGNTNYNPQTKVGLVFDGAQKVAFDVAPNGEAQTFALPKPQTGKDITLQILEWGNLPHKPGLIGIDNFSLMAQRSPDFYGKVKPLLNVGGLMHYPRGQGGMVLCNILFKETEAVPVNAGKKRTIFFTLLRNLKAPFAGGKTLIAGSGLNYSPVDIGKSANQFRNEHGWFGDTKFSFADLPTGRQTFAGVAYDVFEFPTSPVPTAIMLGTVGGLPNNPPAEVKGIPVGRKADALFFLQTARIDRRRNDKEIQDNKKFELARYIVNYADGKSEIVPVYAEMDVDDYRQKGEARAIAGAQTAWTKPYAGTEFSAVAYSKQWNNPRPDMEIQSVDFLSGADKRGVPVLLAITAATAQ